MYFKNVRLFFEQSGIFKNEFKKLGFPARDYDLLNDFDETDFIIDLFKEINLCFDGFGSIFDFFDSSDLIFAFFPCTRFQECNFLLFTGQSYSQRFWTDEQKLLYDIKLHNELNDYYSVFCKLFIICKRMNFKLIVENPYTEPHYLKSFFPIKPLIIDYDRRKNGDIYKKPTQYWFFNCSPSDNLVFESLDYVPGSSICKEHDRVKRSCISSQYAARFIKQFIL